MTGPNDAAVTQLKKDVDTKHLDKFIADLQTDLKGIQDPNQAKQLKQDAQKILIDAKIIPSVDILDSVDSGKINLKYNNQKSLTLDQAGNLRDDKSHLIHSNGPVDQGNTYGYDPQSGELNSISWKDGSDTKSFQKKADGWYDENGQKFDAGKEPKLDQTSGDLSYTRPGETNRTTEKPDGSTVSTAPDGSAITYNPDGKVDKVVDKNNNSHQVSERDSDGAPTKIENKTASGQSEHWEKQPNGTWKNADKPNQVMKDVGINDNGDYYQTHTDGTKETFSPDGKRISETPYQQARHAFRDKLPDALKDKDSVKIEHGSLIWDIAKENLKKHNADHHDPTNTEIANESNRLIKKYNDDPTHKTKINKEGTNVPIGTEIITAFDNKTGTDQQQIKYDGKGEKAQNVNDVKYKNGNSTHIDHNADGSIKAMHMTVGDRTYDVTNTNGKYSVKDQAGVSHDIDAPTVDPDTGAVTLKQTDGKGTVQVNGDGTDTVTGADGQAIHYDGKGHAEKDISDITYANHEQVHFDRTDDGTVRTGNIKGPDGKVKYQLAPRDGGKYALLDADGNDLHTEISAIKTDPDTGAVELDGTKDNKPYKLNIDTKGAETVSDTPAPPAPPQSKVHTDQLANGPAVTYDTDGKDPNHLTDLKYGTKAAAHFDRGTDGAITAGTLQLGSANYKLVKDGYHFAMHQIGPGGQETDSGFTFKAEDVHIDPNTGELMIEGSKGGAAQHIHIKPDGTIA